jgi:hypothetical protein
VSTYNLRTKASAWHDLKRFRSLAHPVIANEGVMIEKIDAPQEGHVEQSRWTKAGRLSRSSRSEVTSPGAGSFCLEFLAFCA